jgi:hypothetical protein
MDDTPTATYPGKALRLGGWQNPRPFGTKDLYFPNGPGICSIMASSAAGEQQHGSELTLAATARLAFHAGAPSDSGFVKSTQKITVPIQQT